MAECGDVLVTIVQGENGTELRQEVVECPDIHYVVAAFLAVFSIGAILLNVLLIVTVAASYTLKKKPLNLFVLSLAVAHVLEAVVSVPLSAAFAARERWPLGVYECRTDAAISETTLVVTSFSVLLLCLDRALMMKHLHNYRKYMTTARRNVAIVLSWAAALGLTSPMLCGYLQALPHEGRYGCSAIDDDKDAVYGALMLVFGYVLPLLCMVTCIVQVGRIIKRERRQLKKLQLKRSFAYTEQVFVTPHLKTEQGPTLMVLAVLLLYVLLVLPQAVTIHLDQAINSYNVTALGEQLKAVRKERLLNATLATNATADANSTLEERLEEQLPMVPNDGIHEPIFMWLRYVFLILCPTVVLTLHKDFRKKVEGLVFCCRPNTVDDYASVRPISAYVKKSTSAKKSGKGRSQNHVTSYKTPVLFSTAGGLHLRVMNLATQRSNMRFLGLDLSLKGSFAPDPEFEIFLCDLSLPSEELADVDNLLERRPEHEDFQETIELAGQSPRSAGTDSGVEVERAARDRQPKQKKVVRFAARPGEIPRRRPSQSDQQALLAPESPPELKPVHSRASTPSPGSRKLQQRTRLRQKPPPAAKPARRASLERTFSVPEVAQRRRSLPPAVGRAAPRPQDKYRPAGGRTAPSPLPPPRGAPRGAPRAAPRRNAADIELETFTADGSFGVVR